MISRLLSFFRSSNFFHSLFPRLCFLCRNEERSYRESPCGNATTTGRAKNTLVIVTCVRGSFRSVSRELRNETSRRLPCPVEYEHPLHGNPRVWVGMLGCVRANCDRTSIILFGAMYHTPLTLTPSTTKLIVHKGKGTVPLTMFDHFDIGRIIIGARP